MKKLLFVLLLSISSVVYAQWTYITENDDTQFFVDLTSIHQIGQYKRVWLKSEYSSNSKITLNENIRSIRTLTEFDCREKKYRQLSLHAFKQSNLIDLDVSSNKQGEWKFIPPKTVADTELTIVCKSK
jgi:hypothetical protein